MKNTFKILFLLAITLVILSLASCGNKEIKLPEESEESTEATTAEENEVNGNEDSTCNHEYEEKTLVAATCQKEGLTRKTCALCGKTQSVSVPKAAHVEVTDAAIAATCTASGKTEGKHCSVCNEVTVPQETIDAQAAYISLFSLSQGQHKGLRQQIKPTIKKLFGTFFPPVKKIKPQSVNIQLLECNIYRIYILFKFQVEVTPVLRCNALQKPQRIFSCGRRIRIF